MVSGSSGVVLTVPYSCGGAHPSRLAGAVSEGSEVLLLAQWAIHQQARIGTNDPHSSPFEESPHVWACHQGHLGVEILVTAD